MHDEEGRSKLEQRFSRHYADFGPEPERSRSPKLELPQHSLRDLIGAKVSVRFFPNSELDAVFPEAWDAVAPSGTAEFVFAGIDLPFILLCYDYKHGAKWVNVQAIRSLKRINAKEPEQ